nr:FeoA domain-containing protein [Gluconobacter sphaericus]
MGRDPIAVRLGTSRFALRRGEAARVGLRTAA